MLKKTIAVATLLITATGSASTHLGVKGQVWPIDEKDIRIVMAEQLSASKEYREGHEAMAAEARSILDSTDGIYLPQSNANKVSTFTPAYVLPADQKYLVQKDDGRFEWEVLYEKGTTVYPLRATRLTSMLFVFDADSPNQLRLASQIAKLSRDEGVEVKLIVTQGSVRNAMEETSEYVYKMPAYALEALPIETVPSLIGQKAPDDEFLTIATQAEPFSAQSLWEDVK